MFKRKIKEKEKERQVIKQEPMDVNPMQQLAEETEQSFPVQQIPEPPVPTPQVPVETKERWVVGEIATSTEKVIHDKTTQKSYDIYSAIALILNKAYEDN